MNVSSLTKTATSFAPEAAMVLSTPITKSATVVAVNPVLSGAQNPLADFSIPIKDLGPQTKAPEVPNGGVPANGGLPNLPGLPGGKGGPDLNDFTNFGDNGPKNPGDVMDIINGRGGKGGIDNWGSSDDDNFGSGKYVPGDKKGLPGAPGSRPGSVGGNGGVIGFGDDGIDIGGGGPAGHGPNSLQGIIDRSQKGYGTDKDTDSSYNKAFVGWVTGGVVGVAVSALVDWGTKTTGSAEKSKSDDKANFYGGCGDKDLNTCANPPQPEPTKDNGGKPDPNAGGGRPDETGTGTGGPRSNAYFPADEGGGGSPISNLGNLYFPADDNGGGGTPRSSTYRPADEGTGSGDPRSNILNVAVKSGFQGFLR